MIRLSRKAWNNVIIFTMLLMILLFNTTNNIFTGGDEELSSISLLPEEAILMTLQMPKVTLERIGQGWQSSTETNYSQEQVQGLVARWQTAQMEIFDEDMPSGMPTIVIVWIAGENSGRVFQMYQQQKDVVVLYQQQLFTLPNMTVDQFVFM